MQKSAVNNSELFEIPSLWGVFLAQYSAKGLLKLILPRKFEIGKISYAPGNEHTRELADQLNEYLSGKRLKFKIKIDLSGYTEFYLSVWREMQKIAYGKTLSYGYLAAHINRPRAARAVGQACGANPLPLIIPCHRVVACNGIGGYSGGLEWKERLFSLEGITF